MRGAAGRRAQCRLAPSRRRRLTTILARLASRTKGGVSAIQRTPYDGLLSVETFESKATTCTAFDLDAPWWRYLHPLGGRTCHGLIFVIDSSNHSGEHIAQARDVLAQILSEDLYKDSLNRAPLLVFANKQDRRERMSVGMIAENLGLKTRSLCGRWHVQPTCATNGDGLLEGLEWLSKQIT